MAAVHLSQHLALQYCALDLAKPRAFSVAEKDGLSECPLFLKWHNKIQATL